MRTFWIIWCCGWALFWMLLGFVTLVTWLLVPLALLAILIPVGVEKNEVTYNYRPPIPNSPYDPRFTKQELENYYGNPNPPNDSI